MKQARIFISSLSSNSSSSELSPSKKKKIYQYHKDYVKSIPQHQSCSQNLHWLKIAERIARKAISLTNYNTLQSSHASYPGHHFTIYCKTSFTAFLFRLNTALPLCHLVTNICQSLRSPSCSASLENSRQYCQKYLTHPTNSPNLTSIFLSLHSSFTQTRKQCSSTNHIPIQPLPSVSLDFSTLNEIHNSRLTLFPLYSLALDQSLIDFTLFERLQISWFPQL